MANIFYILLITIFTLKVTFLLIFEKREIIVLFKYITLIFKSETQGI